MIHPSVIRVNVITIFVQFPYGYERTAHTILQQASDFTIGAIRQLVHSQQVVVDAVLKDRTWTFCSI